MNNSNKTDKKNNIKNNKTALKIVSKRSLAVILSKLKDFRYPKVELEQYTTPSEIAAELLWDLYITESLINKKVLDLGSGTGVLGLGALLLGAKQVIFIEKDLDAIKILEENINKLNKKYDINSNEIKNNKIITNRITKNKIINEKTINRDKIKIINEELTFTDENGDITILNPPFGTRNKHIDIKFLEYAMIHSKIIYTFHKSSTINFIKKRIKELKGIIKKEINYRFPLRNKMTHHKKRIEYIDVTLLKIYV